MERRRGGGEEVAVSAPRWWSQVTHRWSRAAEREDGKYGFQPPSSAAWWLDLINFSGDDDGGDDEAAVCVWGVLFPTFDNTIQVLIIATV